MIKRIKKIISEKKQKGFTLIETLVAITVLLLAIVGPLEIAAQALFSAFYSRDEITAYYLAEEAIEYIKNSRDVTFLNDVFGGGANPNQDWLKGLSACVKDTDTVGCYIDATQSFMTGTSLNSSAIVACSSTELCPKIHFNTVSGIWNYASLTHDVTESKFRRTVVIIPQPNNAVAGEEALIEATVEWQGNEGFGGNRKVVVKGLMTNWERK